MRKLLEGMHARKRFGKQGIMYRGASAGCSRLQSVPYHTCRCGSACSCAVESLSKRRAPSIECTKNTQSSEVLIAEVYVQSVVLCTFCHVLLHSRIAHH